MKKTGLFFTAMLILILLSTLVASVTTEYLTAYYSFDDVDVTLGKADDLHAGYDQSANAATTGAAGKINEAFDYNNGASQRSVAPSIEFKRNSYSFSFWIFPDDITDVGLWKVKADSAFASGVILGSSLLDGNQYDAGWLSGTGNVTINLADWQFIVYTYDNITNKFRMYINTTLVGEFNTGPISFTRQDFSFGHGRTVAGAQVYFDGQIDEWAVFIKALSQVEIEDLWNGGAGLPYPLTLPPVPVGPINVTVIYPLNGSSYNTASLIDLDFNIYINITHNETGAVNCSTNSTEFTHFRNLAQQVDLVNTSFLKDARWHVLAFCNKTGTTNGTDSTQFTIDTNLPTITLQASNGFSTANQSTVNQYLGALLLNITFYDQQDLFAYEINITKDGITFFNFTNTSINDEQANFTALLNVTDWLEGLYLAELVVSDSHTQQAILPYAISRLGNRLTFDTPELNRISIASTGAYSTEYNRGYDRYSFGFNYLFTDSARTFTLTSNHNIYHLEDSRYKAHFVIWNPKTHSGNWVDFEGIGDKYTIIKVSDQEYRIIFQDLAATKHLTLNSIGGLNIVRQLNSWYRGNFTKDFNQVATAGTFQNYELNVSKRPGYVENVTVQFTYNGTARAVSTQIGTNSVLFTSGFTIPELEQSFKLSWNITIIQNDSTKYNFSIDAEQAVFLATLNVTVFDEENGSQINWETITLSFSLESTFSATTGSGSILLGNLTLGEYYVTAESENYPARGLFVTIANQTSSINMYQVFDRVENDYIDYFIFDSGQEAVADARVTFQRSFNGTFLTVAQFETDYAGQGQLFQDQQNEYRLIILHPDFQPTNTSLRPLQTTYTIILDALKESMYENVYDGIFYSIGPRDRILNVSMDPVSVTLDIFADDSSLEYWGIFIDDHNFTCVPASCLSNITGSPAGGLTTVTILGNETGTFDVHYFFKRSGFDIQYMHGIDYTFVILKAIFGENFANIMANLRRDMKTQVMLSIVGAIAIAGLCAIASQIGIIGIGLVMVSVLATIVFMLAGFVDPFTGIIMVVVGIATFFVTARDD